MKYLSKGVPETFLVLKFEYW